MRVMLSAVAATAIFLGSPGAGAWAFGASGEAEDNAFTVRGWHSRLSTSASPSGNWGEAPATRACTPTTTLSSRCYDITPAPTPPPPAWAFATTTATGTAPSALNIEAAVATEFRRIPLTPSGITIQPSRGWTLVNVDTILMTDPTPQTATTTVLGIPVLVRATPARYTWTFGDGSAPLTTTDPGSPWPDHTISHAFRTAGTCTLGLTTEWTGEFQIGGTTTWRPITGTAVTTESAPPLEIRQATNALVRAG